MDAMINDHLKWFYYSGYYPSLKIDDVMRDFQARKSLKAVYSERGLEWPLETEDGPAED